MTNPHRDQPHRIQLSDALPEARKYLIRMTEAASKAAADAAWTGP